MQYRRIPADQSAEERQLEEQRRNYLRGLWDSEQSPETEVLALTSEDEAAEGKLQLPLKRLEEVREERALEAAKNESIERVDRRVQSLREEQSERVDETIRPFRIDAAENAPKVRPQNDSERFEPVLDCVEAIVPEFDAKVITSPHPIRSLRLRERQATETAPAAETLTAAETAPAAETLSAVETSTATETAPESETSAAVETTESASTEAADFERTATAEAPAADTSTPTPADNASDAALAPSASSVSETDRETANAAELDNESDNTEGSDDAGATKQRLQPKRLHLGGPNARADYYEDKAKAEAELEAYRAAAGIRKRRVVDIRHADRSIRRDLLRPAFFVPHQKPSASSLAEALDFARRLHPLPHEMQAVQRPAQRTWLLSQLKNCQNQNDLVKLAFSLNYKDLCLLFPILAGMKYSDSVDKLINIILMRASRYLYFHGWITLQYAYPRSTVQSALGELCQVLEMGGRHEKLLDEPDFFDDFGDLHLGEEHFNWQTMPLISDIAMPNSRHFISSLVNRINSEGLSGAEFFKRYGIYKDLPFGMAVKAQWEMVNIGQKREAFFTTGNLRF